MLFLVTAIQLLVYSSAECEQNANIRMPKIALIIAKHPDDDLTKDRIEIDKGNVADVRAADVPVQQDNASDHFNRGVAHHGAHMYSEAIDAYKSAISAKPDYPEAHYNLALCYMMLNDSSSAHEEYKLLKNIDPQVADNLYNRAVLIARSNPDNKYVVQVGAFRNIQYADELFNKLKANYLHAQIETEDGFSKVRVFGMKNKEAADFMMKDITDKFKIDTFIVPAR